MINFKNKKRTTIGTVFLASLLLIGNPSTASTQNETSNEEKIVSDLQQKRFKQIHPSKDKNEKRLIIRNNLTQMRQVKDFSLLEKLMSRKHLCTFLSHFKIRECNKMEKQEYDPRKNRGQYNLMLIEERLRKQEIGEYYQIWLHPERMPKQVTPDNTEDENPNSSKLELASLLTSVGMLMGGGVLGGIGFVNLNSTFSIAGMSSMISGLCILEVLILPSRKRTIYHVFESAVAVTGALICIRAIPYRRRSSHFGEISKKSYADENYCLRQQRFYKEKAYGVTFIGSALTIYALYLHTKNFAGRGIPDKNEEDLDID